MIEAYIQERDKALLALDLISFEIGKHEEAISKILESKRGKWKIRYVNDTVWFYELQDDWDLKKQELSDKDAQLIGVVRKLSERL